MLTSRVSQPVPLILVKNDDYWLPYTLESLKGKFDKYVIYDVGSTDRTKEILEDFIETEGATADIFHRFLPDSPPEVQGSFRNAMFAEARAEWVFIVDADEVYSPEDMDKTQSLGQAMDRAYQDRGAIYGVFKRREFSTDLKSSYSILRGHHRLYHRTAVFNGPHPGEYPLREQKPHNEAHFEDITCFHFHNTKRSSLTEDNTPSRQSRKLKATYHPGQPQDFNLIEALPMLQKPIGEYPVCPALHELQAEHFQYLSDLSKC